MVTEHDLSNLETKLRGEFQRCVHKAAHELRMDQIRQNSDIRVLETKVGSRSMTDSGSPSARKSSVCPRSWTGPRPVIPLDIQIFLLAVWTVGIFTLGFALGGDLAGG